MGGPGNDQIMSIANEVITGLRQQVADQQSKIEELELRLIDQRYLTFHPFDGKYYPELKPLLPFLTADAEIRGFVRVHAAITQGLVKYGRATQQNVDELMAAVDKISPALAYELEAKVTRHDQIAVRMALGGGDAELARSRKVNEHLIPFLKGFVSEDTAGKLAPGTTSFDYVDTARNWQLKQAVEKVVIPKALQTLEEYLKLAEDYAATAQVGRTHLQWTSPVTFGLEMSRYATQLWGRIQNLRSVAQTLQGKVSGIVGTYASIGLFVGLENVLEFEKYVVQDVLGLKVCPVSSQITDRQPLMDLGNALVSLYSVIDDSAETLRLLTSSEIGEVAEGRAVRERGGSSTDAGKANPITLENITGMFRAVMAGQIALFLMAQSNHQRDLRNSVTNRFEPVMLMCGTYLAASNMQKVLTDLVVFPERMKETLGQSGRYSTAECLNNVLKAYGFPNAYETVRKIAVDVRNHNLMLMREGKPQITLVEYALSNQKIKECWDQKFSPQERVYLTDLAKFTGIAEGKTIQEVNRIRDEISRWKNG